MNLEEIKKRAEEMKKTYGASVYVNHDWAADTILALVTEVERLNECVNSMNSVIDFKNSNIKKLTAANKIMRDCLSDLDKNYEGREADKATKAIAEADETLK